MHPFQHTDLVFVSQLWNQQHCCLWKQSYVKLYANKFGMGLYDVGIYGGVILIWYWLVAIIQTFWTACGLMTVLDEMSQDH